MTDILHKEIHKDGNKRAEMWIDLDDFHTDSMIEVNEVSFKLHRPPEEGPAHIRYSEKGNVVSKAYVVDGHIHNPSGPAIVVHPYPDRRPGFKETYWYWRGEECDNQMDLISEVDDRDQRRLLLLNELS